MTAFKEVEDAAAIRINSTRRFQALSDAVAMAKLAYQLSLDRYRLGAIDYQTLFTSQRSLLTAENSNRHAQHLQRGRPLHTLHVKLSATVGTGKTHA